MCYFCLDLLNGPLRMNGRNSRFVVVNHRRSLCMECSKSRFEGLSIIVLAFDQWLACEVIFSWNLGRRKISMVRSSACRMNQATRDTLHQNLIGDLEVQHLVDARSFGLQHLVQHLRLADRSWESVKHEAVPALRLFNGVFNDAHHELVGYKRSAQHGFLGLHTQWCLVLYGLPQDVPCCQVAEAVIPLYHFRLCALSRSRRAQEHYTLLGGVAAVQPMSHLTHQGRDGHVRQIERRLLCCNRRFPPRHPRPRR
mmetsp:Transcript_48396/g.92598  ORF Transcript_48396/g.92598 Transcript_48396/m.92598 type:complete len:254 (+) Transcript_48396:155-916(+)